MQLRPIKQFNAILTQEYFEPPISWAFRVVLALNVPLIVLPLWKGFSFEVIWAAFGAYMISLTDYRGLHSKKILIQTLESVLIFFAALLGMWVTHSLTLSLIAMFLVGVFAAIVRNWNDYGSSVGVAVGFFFLFGLSNPVPFEESLVCGLYLLIGAFWAIVITLFSFPLRPSNPVKRSVARIWKANTELLDAMILQQNSKTDLAEEITKKEVNVRNSINHSIDLFARRKQGSAVKVQHYDLLIELRRNAAMFSASLNVLHEELAVLNGMAFQPVKDTTLYKTLSAFAQASARLAIVIYTSRPEDHTLAKVRSQRCGIAIELFKESCANLKLTSQEEKALRHFTDTLERANEYLLEAIGLLETKFNLKKSDYFESYKLSFNNFTVGVENWVFTDFLKSLFRFNSEQFKYALRVSVALCAGVFIFKYFKIDHGYWIPLTLMIVIQPYYGATRKKGIERIGGTLGGVVVGGLIMLLPIPHEAFVVLLIFVSFFVAYFLRNNYKVGVFFVTVMMVILMQLSQRGTVELIAWRILSTLIGAFLAFGAGYAFWPVWEKERFPKLMRDALEQSKNYLNRVLSYYTNALEVTDTWYKNRQLTEASNNTVFASVQRMYEEPKHIQHQVDNYFARVSVNMRITREITSIALLVNDNKYKGDLPELQTYKELVSVVFDNLIAETDEATAEAPRPDFNALKECLNASVFSENEQLYFIKTELEKIIFELETLVKLGLKNHQDTKVTQRH